METIQSSDLEEFQKKNEVMATFRDVLEATDVAEMRSKKTKVLHRVVRMAYDDGKVDLEAKTISEQRLGFDYLVVTEKLP